MHIEHFTYGVVTPLLAYALSVLGSLAGLIATTKARGMADNGRRARWLLLAAFAIGGTGIWTMHFVAMMGFSVVGTPVRYDIPITFASWLLAVVVVAIGLFIVGFGRPNAFKVIAAGVLTGVGVAAMHYTGMSAMRTSAAVTYDRDLVIASLAIAVVAATVALWFTVTLRRGVAIFVAALIMGVAVNGMHYTGMYALRMTSTVAPKPISGLLPVTLIGPIGVFVLVVMLVLFGSLLKRTGDNDGGDQTLRIRPSFPQLGPQGGEPGRAPGPAAPTTPPVKRTSAAAMIRSAQNTPPPSAQPPNKRP